MKRKIEPVNELLVEVDGTHHPPVDVPVPTHDWRRVHLSAPPSSFVASMTTVVIRIVKMRKEISHHSLIHHSSLTKQSDIASSFYIFGEDNDAEDNFGFVELTSKYSTLENLE